MTLEGVDKREWGTVRGQPHVIAFLRRALAEERVCHAYLFAGPPGVGKRTTCRLFARALLCTAPEPPCGSCPSCRLTSSGNHPDLHWIEPGSGSIRIEQVRELRRTTALRPFAARRKVFVLVGAEAMTEQAQNALLKTLEEPSGETVVILVSDAPDRLRETILSRVQLVRFGLVPAREVEALLGSRGVDPAAAARLAELAQGMPGRVLDRPQLLDMEQRVRGWIDRLIATDRAVEEVADALEKTPSGSREETDALDLCMIELGRRLRSAAADPGAARAIAAFVHALAAVDEARRQLQRNANRRLVFDVMACALRRAFRERL
ncbi:MAG TPA: DNA polymerase III subunit delta' [Limnochordia bacterium]